MVIYIVQSGDTLYSIGAAYGLSPERIASDNLIPPGQSLVVGQTLVLAFPEEVYTVRQGDTISSIARANGVTVRSLYQNNPILTVQPMIFPGQSIVLSYPPPPYGVLETGGYVYTYVPAEVLSTSLPYLGSLTVFTYGFTEEGTLIVPEDEGVLAMAKGAGVPPVMHLSTLTTGGNFSSELGNQLLNDKAMQEKLLAQILPIMEQKGYIGLDVDFEFLPAEDRLAYIDFITFLRQALNPLGYFVMVALAPKESADQKGLLYESHDYKGLGEAADYVLIMAYEWGYTYGPPMAVAPMNKVRQVLDYAVTEIPPEKIVLGMPNYGYDFALPYVRGESKAKSVGNQAAVSLARQYGAEILFDTVAQAPYFRYTDSEGVIHEVWFEDARSVAATTALMREKGINKQAFWNLMRPWIQAWLVFRGEYVI